MKRYASLAIAAALGLTILGSVAFAGDNHGTSYEDRNGVRWYANYGYDRGLKDGTHSGREDAEKGFRFRATDHGQFKSAMDGYQGHCTKDEYKDSYRAGYMKGYKETYNQVMRSYGYRSLR